jgi:hypothetical protein
MKKMDEKDFGITKVRQAKDNISDLQVYGDGDTFRLLCKASSQSQGWMKSTKVCNVDGGCIVQVTTQQRNPDGSYAVAEGLTYVPRVHIDIDAEPRQLVPIQYPVQSLNSSLSGNSHDDEKYRYTEYLGILLELHKAGHDCHSEINTTLKKVQQLMF